MLFWSVKMEIFFLLLISVAASNTSVCEVTISGVDIGDHGDWTCVISDNLSLDTVKQVVSVGVVVDGDMLLSPTVSPVQLGEGDTAQLVCTVSHAWPRPEISWTLNMDSNVLDTNTQVIFHE